MGDAMSEERKCPAGRPIILGSLSKWYHEAGSSGMGFLGSPCHADASCFTAETDQRRYPWEYTGKAVSKEDCDGATHTVPHYGDEKRKPGQRTADRRIEAKDYRLHDGCSYFAALNSTCNKCGLFIEDRRAQPEQPKIPCPGCGRVLDWPYESGRWRLQHDGHCRSALQERSLACFSNEQHGREVFNCCYQHQHQDQWVDCPGKQEQPSAPGLVERLRLKVADAVTQEREQWRREALFMLGESATALEAAQRENERLRVAATNALEEGCQNPNGACWDYWGQNKTNWCGLCLLEHALKETLDA